jgi:hypothetical protein
VRRKTTVKVDAEMLSMLCSAIKDHGWSRPEDGEPDPYAVLTAAMLELLVALAKEADCRDKECAAMNAYMEAMGQ